MANEMMEANRNRNLNLDFLRVIACVAVIGLHTLHQEISTVTSILYDLCGFAVPVFFMTSGYVLMNRKSVNYSYSFRKIKTILKLTLL